MSTWRQGSWEALARGEASDPLWPEYAEYARLRAQGLRPQSLEAADRCAATLAASDDDAQWGFTAWVFSEVLAPGAVRAMIVPHALEGIVTASLWRAHARGEARATAWLVEWFPVEVMTHLDFETDAIGEFLRRGVAASPGDARLRGMLAEHLVAWVRADGADVPNGRYDGDPEADLQRLAEAESLLEPDAPLQASIDSCRRIVTEWAAGRA